MSSRLLFLLVGIFVNVGSVCADPSYQIFSKLMGSSDFEPTEREYRDGSFCGLTRGPLSPALLQKSQRILSIFRRYFGSLRVERLQVENLARQIEACRRKIAVPRQLYLRGTESQKFDTQFFPDGKVYIHLGLNDPQHKRGGYKLFSRSIDYDKESLVANLVMVLDHKGRSKAVVNEIEVMSRLSSCNRCNQLLSYGMYVSGLNPLRLAVSIQTSLFEQDLRSRYVRIASATHFTRVAQQALESLSATHSLGVVHRDIKAANFLIKGAGSDVDLSLADFGLSEHSESERFGKHIAGTRGYIDPFLCEQHIHSGRAFSKIQDGIKGDLFSLGMTFNSLWFGSANRLKKSVKEMNLKVLPRNKQRVLDVSGFASLLLRYREQYRVEAEKVAEKIKANHGVGHRRDIISLLVLNMLSPEPRHRLSAKELAANFRLSASF